MERERRRSPAAKTLDSLTSVASVGFLSAVFFGAIVFVPAVPVLVFALRASDGLVMVPAETRDPARLALRSFFALPVVAVELLAIWKVTGKATHLALLTFFFPFSTRRIL